MAEPNKMVSKRAPNGQFLKGTIPNPNGRPKKKGTIIELLEIMLEEQAPGSGQPIKEVVARNILLGLLDRKARNYTALLKEALDRLYGKPKESIELSGNAEKPITIRTITAEIPKRDADSD